MDISLLCLSSQAPHNSQASTPTSSFSNTSFTPSQSETPPSSQASFGRVVNFPGEPDPSQAPPTQSPRPPLVPLRRARDCWISSESAVLVDHLLELQRSGDQPQNGFPLKLFQQGAAKVRELQVALGLDPTKTASKCQNHFFKLKQQYNVIRTLKNKSGWGWDDNLFKVVVDKDIWVDYLKQNPKNGFAIHPFPLWPKMEEICEGKVATGDDAMYGSEFSINNQSTQELMGEPGSDDVHRPSPTASSSEEEASTDRNTRRAQNRSQPPPQRRRTALMMINQTRTEIESSASSLISGVEVLAADLREGARSVSSLCNTIIEREQRMQETSQGESNLEKVMQIIEDSHGDICIEDQGRIMLALTKNPQMAKLIITTSNTRLRHSLLLSTI